MGLNLFPGDGDISSPDVAWSYTGFSAFRERLARAEAERTGSNTLISSKPLAVLHLHGAGGDGCEEVDQIPVGVPAEEGVVAPRQSRRHLDELAAPKAPVTPATPAANAAASPYP
ncbi:hypothetical protein [Streptomyces sp. NPDC048637]|uniref:hypothetical protein n=1 Tax=Streptomyces sp. NPDC048637 TaxID=3155636 RepID=UPI003420A755